MSPRKILVWDAPTRLGHWLLVVSFAGALLTGDSERQRILHAAFGATMVGVIAFRLVWGILGSRYARFSSFAFGPRAVLHYLRAIVTLRAVRHLGHTPAGSWAIWSMLGLGVLVGVTGYGAYRGGPDWLEDAHGALAWTLLAVVAVHVAGVFLSSVLHRENLVAAMVTGRKRGEANQSIRGSRWLAAAVLGALALGLWLGRIPVPGLDARGSVPTGVHAGAKHAAHEEDD